MGKILYLECNSGISGDMTVGALLDLGADQEGLKKALDSLEIGGYRLHFGRKSKCGIDGFDFDVILEEAEDTSSHLHSHIRHIHDDEEHHSHVHGHKGCHSHIHSEEAGAGHPHDVHSHHGHSHGSHRNLQDVCAVIDRLESSGQVRRLARRIFEIVAQAEAKAHGLSVEEVHFHEVGAVDSIVDIVSVAWCLENLGVDQVIVSPLSEGHGTVWCQHGRIPVPVPATVHIAQEYGLELKFTDCEGEMVTPTGAAIAAALDSGRRLPGRCTVQKIGVGVGNKEFKHANILRAMILEETSDHPVKSGEANQAGQSSRMWKLETNLDDCSGEAMGMAMESLLQAQAADVWFAPVFMKKNRPGYQISVLCREDQIERMEELLFTHTTTIGIRRYQVDRTVLQREVRCVETAYGTASVKICHRDGAVLCYPEYESVKALCDEHKDFAAGYPGMYHVVREAAERLYQKESAAQEECGIWNS